MPNGTYGGVRGRKTKVGRKLLRFPPTRFINSKKTTDGFERSNNACTDECKHSSTEQWRENLVNKLTIPRHRSIVATQLLSSHCLTYSWKR